MISAVLRISEGRGPQKKKKKEKLFSCERVKDLFQLFYFDSLEGFFIRLKLPGLKRKADPQVHSF